jgi:hypothetical protein
MEEKFLAVLTLYNQLKTLRSDVEKVRTEHVGPTRSLGSGITAYIPHFNSLLERTRQLFVTDPSDLRGSQVIAAIATVEPVKEIEERLSSNYHQKTKQQLLISSGLLLAALEGYKQHIEGESVPVTETREFAFITSPELRKILERDYEEIQKAFVTRCLKSVIILCGGAIEAILLDLLQQKQSAVLATKAPKGKTDITRWDLVDLINVSVEIGLVSNGVEKLSHSVRDYRNLIHPGNEVRNKLTFNTEEARIAIEVLNMVHRDCS